VKKNERFMLAFTAEGEWRTRASFLAGAAFAVYALMLQSKA